MFVFKLNTFNYMIIDYPFNFIFFINLNYVIIVGQWFCLILKFGKSKKALTNLII